MQLLSVISNLYLSSSLIKRKYFHTEAAVKDVFQRAEQKEHEEAPRLKLDLRTRGSICCRNSSRQSHVSAVPDTIGGVLFWWRPPKTAPTSFDGPQWQNGSRPAVAERAFPNAAAQWGPNLPSSTGALIWIPSLPLALVHKQPPPQPAPAHHAARRPQWR